MVIKIIIFSFLLFSSLYSSAVEFYEEDLNIGLLQNSYLFIDKNSTLDFQQIKQKKFSQYNKDKVHIGLSSATVWVKFTIKNSSNKPLDRYIVLNNPQHDVVNLYVKQTDGTYDKYYKGLKQLELYKKNNFLNPSFKISFKKGEQKEFYLKAQSLTSANFFQLYLKEDKELYQDEFLHQIIESFFFGTIFALLIYNIFIFIFTKEVVYLYYIFFIAAVTMNYFSYSIMTYYIFRNNQLLYDIDAYLGPFYILIANIFAILFIDRILQIKQFSYLHRINKLLVVVSSVLIILSIFFENLLKLAMDYCLLALLYIFVVIIIAFLKKVEYSKYILLGWSISLIGLFSLGFIQYDIFTPIDIFPYFYETTVFFEAVIFSTVLSSKLSKTKELEVSLKNNELLIKELHHRVKNNMQFIILMYRLKFINLSDKQIEQKLNEVESSVQAISKTYEILYQYNDADILDTKSYFDNLIEEIKKGFVTKDIEILSDIQVVLDSQQAIYCGIILNELITNSLKYAFKDEKGKIEIALKKNDGKYIFSVADNGVGFKYEENSLETFGLEFIKNIVKDKLQGDIGIDTQNKTAVEITFR